jgi:MoaA/NifB/PqqE/SkfB family radical SAM enzyme
MVIRDNAMRFAVRRAYSYLEKDPVANLPKLVDYVGKIPGIDAFQSQYRAFQNVAHDPNNNWYQLLLRIWTDVHPNIRKHIFENFLINGSFIGFNEQNKWRKKYDCNIPWAILLDPTSACNLHCKGCWAAEYGNKLNLSYDEISDIIKQGKKLGCYVYIYTGGEPLVRKKDLIRICEEHNDCAFLCFTNSTLIDDEFCEELVRVGNFVPIVSIEGNMATTDARRGDGVYNKVMAALKCMREHKVPFGYSVCNTHANTEVVSSEEFYDKMIEWGGFFAWFFMYMPVGNDADPELICSAADRELMYHQVRKFRKTKPLFTLDFFNDGEYVGGCIAGGRRYLHINANGDCDPCVFMHYSTDNIREKSLLECLQGDLFMQYHQNQPFNRNMLRPCPVMDNPGRLVEMVNATEAKSTEMLSPETAEHYTDKCRDAAVEWEPVAERLWESKEHNEGLWIDFDGQQMHGSLESEPPRPKDQEPREQQDREKATQEKRKNAARTHEEELVD